MYMCTRTMYWALNTLGCQFAGIRINKYIWLFFHINDRDLQDHETLQMLHDSSWHYSVKYESYRGGGGGTSDLVPEAIRQDVI